MNIQEEDDNKPECQLVSLPKSSQLDPDAEPDSADSGAAALAVSLNSTLSCECNDPGRNGKGEGAQ